MNLKNNGGMARYVNQMTYEDDGVILKHCISFKRNIEFTYIKNGVVVLKQTILVKGWRWEWWWLLLLKPRQDGKVVSLSVTHAVGHELASLIITY